nr:MAG TPA: hypothetical protein [Caudoviricetes sp.]
MQLLIHWTLYLSTYLLIKNLRPYTFIGSLCFYAVTLILT